MGLEKSRVGFSLSPPSNSSFISNNKYFLTKAVDWFKVSKGKSNKDVKVKLDLDHLSTVAEIGRFLSAHDVLSIVGNKIIAILIKKDFEKLMLLKLKFHYYLNIEIINLKLN
jgi:hypothetical protein